MNDEELRELIRESIARHRASSAPAAAHASAVFSGHPSHVLLPLPRGGDTDEGACLIEPSVRCNHCGYCVSYGH